MSQRRKEQETDDFKVKYRQRSGIESTNSLLKRVTGLGRLRVRGKASVFQSLLLKVAGWNILRASSSMRLMASLKGLLAALAGLIQSLVNQLKMKAFHPQQNSKKIRRNGPVRRDSLRKKRWQNTYFCRLCPLRARQMQSEGCFGMQLLCLLTVNPESPRMPRRRRRQQIKMGMNSAE